MASFLDALKGKSKGNIEEYLDTLGIEEDDLLHEHADMWVKTLDLENVDHVGTISGELKKGNIVLLNIEPLFKKNQIKLRQAVSEVKGIVTEIDGDIARLSEHKILLTPSGVKIAKK